MKHTFKHNPRGFTANVTSIKFVITLSGNRILKRLNSIERWKPLHLEDSNIRTVNVFLFLYAVTLPRLFGSCTSVCRRSNIILVTLYSKFIHLKLERFRLSRKSFLIPIYQKHRVCKICLSCHTVRKSFSGE